MPYKWSFPFIFNSYVKLPEGIPRKYGLQMALYLHFLLALRLQNWRHWHMPKSSERHNFFNHIFTHNNRPQKMTGLSLWCDWFRLHAFALASARDAGFFSDPVPRVPATWRYIMTAEKMLVSTSLHVKKRTWTTHAHIYIQHIYISVYLSFCLSICLLSFLYTWSNWFYPCNQSK